MLEDGSQLVNKMGTRHLLKHHKLQRNDEMHARQTRNERNITFTNPTLFLYISHTSIIHPRPILRPIQSKNQCTQRSAQGGYQVLEKRKRKATGEAASKTGDEAIQPYQTLEHGKSTCCRHPASSQQGPRYQAIESSNPAQRKHRPAAHERSYQNGLH